MFLLVCIDSMMADKVSKQGSYPELPHSWEQIRKAQAAGVGNGVSQKVVQSVRLYGFNIKIRAAWGLYDMMDLVKEVARGHAGKVKEMDEVVD